MTEIARRGLCLVLAAPSGTGQEHHFAPVAGAASRGSRVSVSVTTRAPRAGERDGVHYHFRTEAEFAALTRSGGLLEWAQVLGRDSYGTPRAPVEAALAAGQDIIFDIDWQGYRSLRAALPGDVVGVYLLPPSLPDLVARLQARGGDTPEEIARRMARARDEIAHCPEFDHVVVNDDLPRAVDAVGAILHAARLATPRLTGLPAFIATLGG